MPSRAPSACRRPGCPGLVRNGTCTICGPVQRATGWQAWHAERNQESRHVRGYGTSWYKLRAHILARDDGLCRVCGRPASEVDHIVAKSAGGSDDEDNLQAICSACHAKKTALEGVGGVGGA